MRSTNIVLGPSVQVFCLSVFAFVTVLFDRQDCTVTSVFLLCVTEQISPFIPVELCYPQLLHMTTQILNCTTPKGTAPKTYNVNDSSGVM